MPLKDAVVRNAKPGAQLKKLSDGGGLHVLIQPTGGMDEQAGKVLDALEACGLSDLTRVIYTSDHGDAVGSRGLWGKSTMHEEVLGVPMIVAGDGIPRGRVVDTPASLLDIYPFIMDCAGESGLDFVEAGYPGVSIARLAVGETPTRTVLSEYHGLGSIQPAPLRSVTGATSTYTTQNIDLNCSISKPIQTRPAILPQNRAAPTS